jgi:hypothetical protein
MSRDNEVLTCGVLFWSLSVAVYLENKWSRINSLCRRNSISLSTKGNWYIESAMCYKVTRKGGSSKDLPLLIINWSVPSYSATSLESTVIILYLKKSVKDKCNSNENENRRKEKDTAKRKLSFPAVPSERTSKAPMHKLGYKPEDRGFETRWSEILNLRNPSGRTRPWGLLSL